MKQRRIKIFTDGGSRGNPGPAAEYTAIRLGLEGAAKYDPEEIECYMDSELAVRQLNGQYRVKNENLRPIFEEIKKLAHNYKVTFQHVYREKNKLADAEVNKAIDRALGLKK
jgi:ribonuclease HI